MQSSYTFWALKCYLFFSRSSLAMCLIRRQTVNKLPTLMSVSVMGKTYSLIWGTTGDRKHKAVAKVSRAMRCCLAMGPKKRWVAPIAPPSTRAYAVNIAKSAAAKPKHIEVLLPPAMPAPTKIIVSDKRSGNSL